MNKAPASFRIYYHYLFIETKPVAFFEFLLLLLLIQNTSSAFEVLERRVNPPKHSKSEKYICGDAYEFIVT